MSLAHLNAPFEEAVNLCLRENKHPFPGLLKGEVTVWFGLAQTSVPISGDVPTVDQLPDWDVITGKTCKYSH